MGRKRTPGMKWEIGTAERRGEQILALAREDLAELAPRGITSEVLDEFAATVASLRERRALQQARRTRIKERTAAQNQEIRVGAQFVSDLRGAVRQGLRKNQEVRRAVGVGQIVKPLVASVRSALSLVVTASGRFAAELATVGIVASDFAKAVALLDTLVETDQEQDATEAHSKGGTEIKNDVLRATIAGVDRIVAAARVGLAGRRARLRLYLDLARWPADRRGARVTNGVRVEIGTTAGNGATAGIAATAGEGATNGSMAVAEVQAASVARTTVTPFGVVRLRSPTHPPWGSPGTSH